jgi:phosphoribosylformimino-5-aminoimidazole carboxamide ribotide isomerase
MKLIAGLDIKDGKCVHLTQGDIESTRVRYERPVELCKLLESKGIDKLHIVDIDGVFSGKTDMFDLLSSIRENTNIPIQFGGGIRDYETAVKVLEMGINEIVLGTTAIQNQELLIDLLDQYKERVVVAADVYKGFVYIEGWEENSSTTIDEFLNTLELLDVKTVMVTDISSDGTLKGVDMNFVETLISHTKLSIILSGGVNSDQDIKILKNKNLEGVVVSTALYEGLITV